MKDLRSYNFWILVPYSLMKKEMTKFKSFDYTECLEYKICFNFITILLGVTESNSSQNTIADSRKRQDLNTVIRIFSQPRQNCSQSVSLPHLSKREKIKF